jgi:hypothetical protein
MLVPDSLMLVQVLLHKHNSLSGISHPNRFSAEFCRQGSWLGPLIPILINQNWYQMKSTKSWCRNVRLVLSGGLTIDSIELAGVLFS